jgi:hypothetical protein
MRLIEEPLTLNARVWGADVVPTRARVGCYAYESVCEEVANRNKVFAGNGGTLLIIKGKVQLDEVHDMSHWVG